jgi:hypothetical protein
MGNIFACFFLAAQWDCMARSISIDCLGFHNFKPGTDSIIAKHDEKRLTILTRSAETRTSIAIHFRQIFSVSQSWDATVQQDLKCNMKPVRQL